MSKNNFTPKLPDTLRFEITVYVNPPTPNIEVVYCRASPYELDNPDYKFDCTKNIVTNDDGVWFFSHMVLPTPVPIKLSMGDSFTTFLAYQGHSGDNGYFFNYDIETQQWSVYEKPISKVSGYVKDIETGYPLSGALVSCNLNDVYTDELGYFEFTKLALGTYTMRASVTGYDKLEKTVNINAPEWFTVNFSLTKSGSGDVIPSKSYLGLFVLGSGIIGLIIGISSRKKQKLKS